MKGTRTNQHSRVGEHRVAAPGRAGLLAAATAVALAAGGCGVAEFAAESPAAPGVAAAPTGAITVRGCKPQYPLIPSNTNETCGGNVIDAVAGSLVRYNATTGKAENDLAASITTTDRQNYTIKLKPGLKFSDGSPLTASSFVKAWNFAAYGPNAQLNSYFFEPVKGYRTVAKGSTKSMAGLKVVNPTTFTVALYAKSSSFPQRLGYLAFAPLPASFFADNGKAYGRKPVGAGPFKVSSADPNAAFVLVANPNYGGSHKPQVAKVTVKVYKSVESAYSDMLAGKLDLIDEVPVSAADAKADLSGRLMRRTVGVFQSLTVSPVKTDPSYKNPKLRQAISVAIDRQKIIDQQFGGGRIAARGWVSPVVYGYKAGACGPYCTYDPVLARKLYKAAGGHSGAITIAYNGDSSHKGWVDAACASISKVLSVTCKGRAIATFSAFRARVVDREMKGLFRSGWQMDYPSIENFLGPLYATTGSSNDAGYSNAKFDAKLAAAEAAASPTTANTLFQEAEAMLRSGMPAIPLWHTQAVGGYSARVAGARLTIFGTYDLLSVSVK